MSDVLKMYKAFLATLESNPYDELTHRALADFLEEQGEDDEALVHREWTKPNQEAKDFLKKLAGELRMTYEELIKEGHDIASGFYCFGDDDGPEVIRDGWEDFQRHWRVLTGQDTPKVSIDDTYFRCAC